MSFEGWISRNTIHSIYAGSRLYGTDVPGSDYDVRAICLMPPEVLLGMSKFEQSVSTVDGEDYVAYGLNRFFVLTLGNNPTMLDILFAPPGKWHVTTAEWTKIYMNRHAFLSTRLRDAFLGNARGQIKKMFVQEDNSQKYAKYWYNNPPNPPIFIGDAFQKSRDVSKIKVGYDAKHAGHVIRLLIQGKTILQTGDYNPTLAGEPLRVVSATLRGVVPREEVMSMATDMLHDLSTVKTNLPDEPDRCLLHQILFDINYSTVSRNWPYIVKIEC